MLLSTPLPARSKSKFHCVFVVLSFGSDFTIISLSVLAFFGASSFLLAASFARCGEVAFSVFCLAMASGFLQFNGAGFLLAPADLSPAFSGLIAGIANTSGTLAGCLAPIVTGLFTNKQVSLAQGVFSATAECIYFFNYRL